MTTALIVPCAVAAKVEYMSPTHYIDSNHPAIVDTVHTITAGARDARDKAVRIHDFVRDQVRFGWAPSFYDQKASDVLAAGVGFCNTKSTLFVALLRAAGIPARQHFVNIHAGILAGLINPGTPYVDHSFAEVWLAGTWWQVDSYIVDRSLMTQAQARLAAENRLLGYGVHRHGVSEWDGRSHAFSQLVNDKSVPDLTTADHGIYADVGELYASGRGLNTLNIGARFLFGLFSRSANRRIEALREAAPRLSHATLGSGA